MKTRKQNPKLLVFLGLIAGVALVPALRLALSKLPEAAFSDECFVTVKNQSDNPIWAVPLSSDAQTKKASPLLIKPGAQEKVLLVRAECEGIKAYPEGPLFTVSFLDEARVQVKKTVTVLDGLSRPLIEVE